MTITVMQIIPNMGAGGAEQACVDMASGLVARGDRAIVVSNGGSRVLEAERVGGKHYEIPVHSKNPFVIIANALWLAVLIKKNGVDIVHVRSRAPAWSAWMACRITNIPLVTTFHAAYKFSNNIKKAYNKIMTKAVRVIAISDYIADHIRKNYLLPIEIIRVVYRGIDRSRFCRENVLESSRVALRNHWSIGEKDKIILLPARLSPIKGQKLAIEAMSLLAHDPDAANAKLIILGDDQGRAAYRQSLEALIANEGLQNCVRLVGHTDNMPAALSLADVVLVPSMVPEGFGRVPVEAQAMGVPVIASDLGATRETIIEGETGWLLPPENPKIWAQAVAKVLHLDASDRAAFAAKAVSIIDEKFTRERMIKDTLDVYDEIVTHA